jgi:hypothetical protein
MEKPEEKDHLEDQVVDGRIGSEWISGRLAERRVDATGSVFGSVAGCCKYGDEPSGSGATELIN